MEIRKTDTEWELIPESMEDIEFMEDYFPSASQRKDKINNTINYYFIPIKRR